MEQVRAKKYLGQHFLKDEGIAQRIASSISPSTKCLVEVGPGMGVLTKYLVQRSDIDFHAVEIDSESVVYLNQHYPELKLIEADFLRLNLSNFLAPAQPTLSIIGNFPYNISSQILFKVFDNRSIVTEVVGMFQKEVAERVAAKPGCKTYGILSVLLSAFYDIEYLFTVSEDVFSPPPKVKSAVIRLRRNTVDALPCDESLFVKVVKTGFNQRRKTLHNALKPLGLNADSVPSDLLRQRAEQLSVSDFILITNHLC